MWLVVVLLGFVEGFYKGKKKSFSGDFPGRLTKETSREANLTKSDMTMMEST